MHPPLPGGQKRGKAGATRYPLRPGSSGSQQLSRRYQNRALQLKVFLYIIVINLFGVGRAASPPPFASRASSMDAPVRPGTGRWAGSDPPADSPPQPLSCPNKGAFDCAWPSLATASREPALTLHTRGTQQ